MGELGRGNLCCIESLDGRIQGGVGCRFSFVSLRCRSVFSCQLQEENSIVCSIYVTFFHDFLHAVGVPDFGGLSEYTSAMMRSCFPFSEPLHTTVNPVDTSHQLPLATQVDIADIEPVPAPVTLLKAVASTHSLIAKDSTLHHSGPFTIEDPGA